jgi:hypothetical protein
MSKQAAGQSSVTCHWATEGMRPAVPASDY